MSRKKWLALTGVSVVATSVVALAATSFQVQTKLATSGGKLQVPGKADQVAVGSIVYTYTALDSLPVKVRANYGYKISSLNKTGALMPFGANGFTNYTSVTIPFLKADGNPQSLTASFAAVKNTVSATVTGPGTVTPSSASVNYNGNLTMKATPTFVYGYIADVTVNGASIISEPAAGPYSFSVTNVKDATAVGVTFRNATVKLGANKTVANGSAVTLDSQAADGTTLAWYVDNALQAGQTGSTLSYTALNGAHTIKVTSSVGGRILATSTVQVTGVADLAAAMGTTCNGCHDPLAGAVPSNAYAAWMASSHKVKNVTCVTCHTDGPMPTPMNTATVDKDTFMIKAASLGTVGTVYCAKCHAASVTKVQGSLHYTMEAGKLTCQDCHATGHNPVATSAACSTCHATVDDHTDSAMAGKTCIQCHDKHDPKTVTATLGPQPVHPAVTLFTFEEVGYQMNNGQPVPVQVDANGKGMPYSPKMTCGTSGCHVINGVNYTYDKISDHAFHSAQGRNEMQDTTDGKLDARKNKPWGQSTAMVGKW